MSVPVIGRLAPSPTGILHLGNVRTFLWAWLAARARGGRVILRIEDLEKPRSGLVLEDMLSDLRWLGFDWDEGPVWTAADDADLVEIKRFPRARQRAIGCMVPCQGPHGAYIQSQRGDFYQNVFDQLLAADLIYPCRCERSDYANHRGAPHDGEIEPCYPGTCRQLSVSADEARCWRFRVTAGMTVFNDELRGTCRIDVAGTVGDFVVFKTPRQPSYQLAAAADDWAMGVNQVVRGDDLISSTARQILIWRAVAGSAREVPQYGHVPLVVGPDGARLAKRHGDGRLHSFRERGVDPRRLVGCLAAWSGLGDGRPRSLVDLLPDFDWGKLNRNRLVLKPEMLDGI